MTRLADALASMPIMRPSDPVNEHFARIERRRPRMKRVYSTSKADREALLGVVKASWLDYHAEQLPASWRASTAAGLAAELVRVFNQGEMAVLDGWGYATSRDSVVVGLGVLGVARMDLPKIVLTPPANGLGVIFQRFDLRSVDRGVLLVPDAFRPFFEADEAARAAKADLFDRALSWTVRMPKQQRPTWGEIAAEFPRLEKRIREL